MHPRLHTHFCELVGVEYPIVQTGMGWVSGAGLTAATASAGGLGLLASATMDFGQLKTAIAQVKRRTDNPFGVNLRADAADIGDRVKLLIDEQVKVASFAQAPKEALIGQLHDGGVLVVPSIGAKRHAEKVLEWGVDAVLVQGGEGGGHTGSVPTTILLPQVVDAVQGRVPVVAAGGFFDGRGLVAALAYGADAVAMGTRFLLSADSAVPQVVKDYYLGKTVTETVVTKQIDGVPHRMLDTELVEEVESGRGKVWALPRATANAWRFHKLSGISLPAMTKEGLAMRKSLGLTWTQTLMAANAPMLTKAALVDGKVESGVLPSGQVVGVIDDLPTCKELIDRIIAEAEKVLENLEGTSDEPRVFNGVESVKAAQGEHLGYSDWLEISQERVNTFAEATGDFQWIHIDVERAKEGPFGGTIAHGYLTLSLASFFLPQIARYEGFAMAINYGVDKVRFVAPVLVGKRIRAGAEMMEVTDVKGGIQTKVLITIEIEGSERPACVIESISRWLA